MCTIKMWHKIVNGLPATLPFYNKNCTLILHIFHTTTLNIQYLIQTFWTMFLLIIAPICFGFSSCNCGRFITYPPAHGTPCYIVHPTAKLLNCVYAKKNTKNEDWYIYHLFFKYTQRKRPKLQVWPFAPKRIDADVLDFFFFWVLFKLALTCNHP